MSKDIDKGIEDDDFITWKRLMVVYGDMRAMQNRIEILEKKQDDWKIWLEGFKEGFTIKKEIK